MIEGLAVLGLREIQNKENILCVQDGKQTLKPACQAKTKKVKLKKKNKENTDRSINGDKTAAQSKITEKIKADIAAALT